MQKISLTIVIILLSHSLLISQVAINTDGSLPDNSAMLDVKSSGTGLLFPRLSNEDRNSIPSPETGLLIFNTSSNLVNYYDGSQWCQVVSSASSTTTGSYRPGGGVSINAGPGTLPDSSAILDINNPSRGVLIPRTIPASITSPVRGLIIYNTLTNLINYYDGNEWIGLCATSTGTSGAGGVQIAVGFAINATGSEMNPSAILDVSATDKGVLIPRLTCSQRDALLPAVGLTVYNLSSNSIEFYNGSGWQKLNVNLVSPPVAGAHVTAVGQITWKWRQVTGANGYKWNTVNAIETATDIGTDTSYSETGLTCESAYTRYVWAYNTCGVTGPLTMNATTLSCCWIPISDARDGQVYSTVLIGAQCWMSESLNYGTMISHFSSMANNGVAEKYCYDNDELKCLEWGALYQWDEAMQYTTTEGAQGICPASWHIPTESEWDILENYLGGDNVAGGKMKEAGYIHWASPNTGATNSSGFTALGSGVIEITAGYPSKNLYTHTYYWASTQVDSEYARRRGIFHFSARSYPYFDLKWIGFSIRCMKD